MGGVGDSSIECTWEVLGYITISSMDEAVCLHIPESSHSRYIVSLHLLWTIDSCFLSSGTGNTKKKQFRSSASYFFEGDSHCEKKEIHGCCSIIGLISVRATALHCCFKSSHAIIPCSVSKQL